MIKRAEISDARTPADIAGEWFARRRSGRMTAAEARELERWLDSAVGNRTAMEQIERAWHSIEGARAAPEILALRERARGRRAGLSRPALTRAAAACVAAVVLTAGGFYLTSSGFLDRHRFADQTYATAIGEKTTVTLPDGSVITLNTDSVLRTRASRDERLVYLDRGQAFFRVAKNPDRPFIVSAAGRQVTAIGTAFDVRVDGHRFEVTLVEGKVRVDTPVTTLPDTPRPPTASRAEDTAPVRATELLPGDRMVATLDNQVVVARADTAKQTNWMVGRLKFEGEPMGRVAAEFGRYTTRKIVIDDAALAARPISGTFDADDTEAFADALQIAGLARIESATPGVIKLAPPEN
jgi:transmembrane sensor